MTTSGSWRVHTARFTALWIAIAAFFAVQVRLRYTYAGEEISWPAAFVVSLVEWLAWAVVAPLLWWLARRFPFERESWIRSAAVHLPAILAVSLLALALQSAFLAALAGVMPQVGGTPQTGALNTALLTTLLLSGICHAIVHSRAAQERRTRAVELEARLTQARLDLLRSQLQPHFLFNTLNAVTTLMHRDAHAAEKMLTRLADLLRLTLDLRDRQEVTLREELELTETFLAIQQVRFGERLQVTREVDPALYDALVPTMILQPLVENAVDHGIGRRSGDGKVSLSAAIHDGELRLVVRDDGPGFAEVDSAEGVGLANTRERLAQLYGEAASLTVAPGAELGVEVVVRLLLCRDEEDARSGGR